MGEIKSVKVDNWGVFFLQKLQNFFNKTDYCDLTLQFRDNSQLKVHRLVLSACTDYFNVLEQTCDIVDDALIMPIELQADVVVPIVNFMYTGTLEFELKMYGRLLRTAKEMNMTVLLKLLEAHRRTMEGVNRAQRPPSPKAIRRRGPPPAAGTASAQQIQQQRRILATANVSPQRRAGMQQKNITGSGQQAQVMTFRQQIGSTQVVRTVKQEIKQEPGYDAPTQSQATSPFEQLRRGYNNNKRPASSTFVAPPAKKPNIEDVKEFAEQQRMRKQIAAEYGEDPEYEGMLDDDIHDDDDDDDGTAASSSAEQQRSTNSITITPTNARQKQQQKQQQQQKQEQGATITIKHNQNNKSPTFIVKDSTNSNKDHAKLISEVLRQFPDLVKGNKNIKLKIVPNGQSQKIIVKRESVNEPETAMSKSSIAAANVVQRVQQKQPQITIRKVESLATSPNAKVAKTSSNAQQTTSTAVAAPTSSTTLVATGEKRRIDSKTMHSLIALGAENTTGTILSSILILYKNSHIQSFIRDLT